MGLEEVGVKLIVDGADSFGSAMSGALDAVTGFATVGLAALATGFGVALAAGLDNEKMQSSLALSINLANEAITAQGDAYDAAVGKVITGTRLGAAAMGELQDKLITATAKLHDMEAAYAKSKEPTETMTLNLQKQREKVAELTAAISRGSEVVSTNLVDALHLVPRAAGFTLDAMNKLAQSFADLAGGSDDLILQIETIGLRAGTVSAEQMPKFIQTTLDLGIVMGDTASAATLLARAQEDPVAAMGRAQKAGIIFTDELKDQIKHLVKVGDTAGATALFLDRVADSTKGAAAANANTLSGQLEIMKGRLGEAAETIGTAMLPMMRELFDNTIKPALPIVELLAKGVGDAISAFASGEEGIGGMMRILGSAVDTILPGAYEWFLNLGRSLSDFVGFIQDNMPAIQQTFTVVFASIMNIAGQLGAFFNDVLMPAIVTILGVMTGTQSTNAQEVFTGVMNAIQQGAALAAWWVNDTLVPALTAAVDWIVANWPAIQATIVGAFEAVSAFWTTTLQPALADLAAWLQVNVPIAMAALVNFWNTTLLPALTALWAYIKDPVIPIIMSIADWLGVNVPIAMAALVNFWNTTLYPALQALWAFINDPLIPLVTALAEVFSEVLRLAWENIVFLWNTFLKPALDALGTFMNDTILPILTDVAHAFGKIADKIDDVIDWLKDLRTALEDLHIPPAFTPGSPTPFELGLRGIESAARDAGKALADLAMPAGSMPDIQAATSFGRAGPPVFGGAHPGALGGATTNNNVTVNASYGREQSLPSIWGDVNLGLTLAAM